MKSLTAICQTAGASMPAINPSGRAISRHHHHHHPQRENAEMKMYLSKLKDLVPFMPKNRKLSKLEIIQHVIDYICDLQSELETHPEMGNFDAASALNFVAASQNVMTNPTTSDSLEMEADDLDEDEDVAEGVENGAEVQQIEADDALTQRLSAEATAATASLSQQQRHQRYQHQMQQQQQQLHQSSPAAVRQPLMDRQAPNTILAPSSSAAHSASHVAVSTPQQQQHQHQLAVLMMTSTSQATSTEKYSRTNSC